MPYFYNDYVSAVSRKLRNPTSIQEEEYEAVVDEALTIYSAYFPRIQVYDTTGATGYAIVLPSDFVEGFSSLLQIEYPYESDAETPTIIGDSGYVLDRNPTGLYLRCLTFEPSTTEVTRITYSSLHIVTSTGTTVPLNHEKAIANLGAGLLGEMLAAEYQKKALTALPDVEFDMRYKAREYQTQSDRYYRLWKSGVGISEDGKPSAACAWTDIDMRYTWGTRWLIRSNR